MKHYLYLSVAIIFEVFGSTMLKFAKGFTVLWPSLGVIASFTISFYSLGLSLKGLPLSIAYAIWSGLGTAIVVLTGYLLFAERISILKIFAVGCVIYGIYLLHNSKPKQVDKKQEMSL